LANPVGGRVRSGVPFHAANWRCEAATLLGFWVFLPVMRLLYLALVLTLAFVLVPSSALAESKQIQVLTVMSPEAFDNANALTVALKRVISRAEGWSLAPGDYSLEVLLAGFNCDEQPDNECLQKIAGSIESSRFIWGTMDVVDDQVRTELHLWSEGRNVGQASLRYSRNLTDPSDDTLISMAEDAFHELLGESEGRLIVIAGDATGDVYVNGELSGRIEDGTAKLMVQAGELEVVVKAPGYLDGRSKTTLRPGDKTKLVLELVRDPDYVEPKAKKSREHRKATEPARDRKQRKSVSTQKAVGLGAVGAGVIVAGVGGGYWISSYGQRNDDAYEDYRSTVDQDADPCEQAKVDQREDIIDHCEANRTTRTMARILTPAGGVVAVAGLVLVLTDKPANERVQRRIRPSVAVGPRGGRMDLTVHF
jgi:hypothetical protein